MKRAPAIHALSTKGSRVSGTIMQTTLPITMVLLRALTMSLVARTEPIAVETISPANTRPRALGGRPNSTRNGW
jgi:hypothetical protein